MDASVRCVKTPKGLEEMTGRKYGLSQRHRRVLILIDGSRALNDLAGMVPDPDLSALFSDLVEQEFITALDGAPSQGGASAQSGGERRPPPANDMERFNMARNFMINTTRTFLGVSGSGLMGRVEEAVNFEDLRAYYNDWSSGLRLTSDGRKVADKLEQQLASLIS